MSGLRTRDVAGAGMPVMRHVHEAFGRSVALVMGINIYEHGVPRLTTAVPDAEAIAALLAAQHGFIPVLRRDREVTNQQLRTTLARGFSDELGGALTERDRLVVYFAGHGLSLPSAHGPAGQLLLADADAGDPASLFAMSELHALLGALPCRHRLLVLDCCFAGTFQWAGTQDRRRAPCPAYRETLDRFVQHRAWQVLVSASHDQPALDSVPARRDASGPIPLEVMTTLRALRIETATHSPFAAALLRALGGEADYTKDDLIIPTELELFVRDKVEKSTQGKQSPKLYKLDDHTPGEFVFQVPGTTLALAAAPALAPANCPYQGLEPYAATEHDRFFGRAATVGALVAQIQAHPLTVVLGATGAGKSSLLAAGVVPALRDQLGWTVIEHRPDPSRRPTLRDLVAGLAAQPAGPLCLVIDQTEHLALAASPAARARVIADLADALAHHGERLRVVLALRSELEPMFRASSLAQRWTDSLFIVPPLAQDELRAIITGPARAAELGFEPASLVDALINDVLEAPGGLPLLSFALRELYLRCAARNTDRLLRETDYAAMGRLGGALAQRASAVLQALVAQDAAYAATARRVFLRMVTRAEVSEGAEAAWISRRVHCRDLVYGDLAENARVDALLAAFCDARLIVLDRGRWEPAHSSLVTGWPAVETWRRELGSEAITLQRALADATRHWHLDRRPVHLWTHDDRLPAALRAMRAPASWLNAREHAFVTASVRRRTRRAALPVAALVVALVAGFVVWDQMYRLHVDYYRSYVRQWGAPQGIDPITDREARARTSSVKLVRKGQDGHVVHVELARGGDGPARATADSLGDQPELAIGAGAGAAGERTACQWDFAYDADTGNVAAETARDRAGNVVYRLEYHGGGRDRVKAEFLDDHGNAARIHRGNAERVEFVRSAQGYDEEKRYMQQYGAPARNQEGVSRERLGYDGRGNLISQAYFDEADRPMRGKDGVAAWRATFDDHGDPIARRFFDDQGRAARNKDWIAGWRATFDDHGNEVTRAFFDDQGRPTRNADQVAGWRATFDARGHEIARVFLDERGRPTRHHAGYASWRAAFDARGHEIARSWFDVAGAPTRTTDGIAGWRATFDDDGNEIQHRFVDPAGAPTDHAEGYAGWHARFDGRGNEIARTFVDVADRLVYHRDKYAGWRATFDDRSNEIARSFLDVAGQPARIAAGIAGWRSRRDDRDHEIERTFVDEHGQPTTNNDGYAGWHATFDAWGNEIERAFLDEAGEPTTDHRHRAGWRATFDPWGNELTSVDIMPDGIANPFVVSDDDPDSPPRDISQKEHRRRPLGGVPTR